MNTVQKPTISSPSGPRVEARRPQPKAKNWKKFTLPALLVILIAIPFTIFLAQQTQDIRQRAAEPATVADKSADLKNTAAGQMCTAANIDAFLIVDKSESMENKNNGKTKLAWAKEAARSFVQLMATQDTNYVGIASFARRGGINLGLTQAKQTAPIIDKINDLHNGSDRNGTCLECAMIDVNKAIANRGGANRKFILILSDGNINFVRKPNGDPNGPDEKKGKAQARGQILAAANAGTTIYLIGIGVQNGDGQKYLQGLASENPARIKYVYAGGGDANIKTVYDQIATTIGKVSVSGTVFEDIDEDGKFTVPPDAAMSDVLVSLYKGTDTPPSANASSSATPLLTVKTGADGKYSFTNLCADKYRIGQTIKDGYHQTVPVDPPGYYEIDVNKETKDITDKNFGNSKGEISFTFKFALHGIGIAGDNVEPRPQPCQRVASGSGAQSGCLSNQEPKHPERNLFLEVLDTTDRALATLSGKLNYQSGEGIFTGDGKITSGIRKGMYTFRALTPMFLGKKITFDQEVKPGESYELPLTDLISSDVDNDNQLSILDYNLIADCYTYPDMQPPCDQAKAESVDTNDDGVVNEFDVNLFIRELSARIGE